MGTQRLLCSGGGFTRRLLLVALVTVAAATIAPSPLTSPTAHACSCNDPADIVATLRQSADATFLGTVHEIRRPELPLSSISETRYIFDVEEVFNGADVRARQSIVTATDGASCGLELPVGAKALVFARREDFELTPDDGEFTANLCQVIAQPMTTALDALGEGRPPEPGTSPIGADDGIASRLVRYWYWPAAIVTAVLIAAAARTGRGFRRSIG